MPPPRSKAEKKTIATFLLMLFRISFWSFERSCQTFFSASFGQQQSTSKPELVTVLRLNWIHLSLAVSVSVSISLSLSLSLSGKSTNTRTFSHTHTRWLSLSGTSTLKCAQASSGRKKRLKRVTVASPTFNVDVVVVVVAVVVFFRRTVSPIAVRESASAVQGQECSKVVLTKKIKETAISLFGAILSSDAFLGKNFVSLM